MSAPPTPISDSATTTNITIVGEVKECERVNLTWTNGVSPVRIEFYQQDGDTSDWDVIPEGMTNVYYNGTQGLLEWQVNARQGRRLWVSIVDHNGYYAQNREPWIVQDGSDDCLTVQRPMHESGLTNMAKVFLTFLIVAIAIVFYLLFAIHRMRRSSRKMRHTLSRPIIEDDAHGLNSARYSPYQISPTINNDSPLSPTADTINSRPYNPFTDRDPDMSASPTTWNSQQALLLNASGRQERDMTETRQKTAPSLTHSLSGRSSIAPSFQSSQNETIHTTATMNTSASSRGVSGDTESEASSSLHESPSNAQFFPLRVPAGAMTWNKGSFNPFARS